MKKLASIQSRTFVTAGDQRRDEVVMVERERGEGSEDGSVTRRQREDTENDSRKPIPLEILLNSPLVSEESIVLQSELEPVSFDQYSESLAIVEKRCSHLAALLAESEANEARLSQLSDALKEEIRRTERAEERQKHIENLEYLKNVVLKVSSTIKVNFKNSTSFTFEFRFPWILFSLLLYPEEKNVAGWFRCLPPC